MILPMGIKINTATPTSSHAGNRLFPEKLNTLKTLFFGPRYELRLGGKFQGFYMSDCREDEKSVVNLKLSITVVLSQADVSIVCPSLEQSKAPRTDISQFYFRLHLHSKLHTVLS